MINNSRCNDFCLSRYGILVIMMTMTMMTTMKMMMTMTMTMTLTTTMMMIKSSFNEDAYLAICSKDLKTQTSTRRKQYKTIIRRTIVP